LAGRIEAVKSRKMMGKTGNFVGNFPLVPIAQPWLSSEAIFLISRKNIQGEWWSAFVRDHGNKRM